MIQCKVVSSGCTLFPIPASTLHIHCVQEYWPAVIKFAQQHTSAHETDETGRGQGDKGVEAAVQASQAGMKPPSAVGPFVSDSSQPVLAPAVKKEL